MKNKILFLLKVRDDSYGNAAYSYGHYFSSGLYWSARFVVEMLLASGVEAKLVQVVDNNDIDREVSNFKPDTVVIEALWVVPEKFDILKKLHPGVEWIVRLHSNLPFLANEGIAIKWLKGYEKRNIRVATNSKKALDDFNHIFQASYLSDKVLFLPNYYPVQEKSVHKGNRDHINIACYGAIRPLKNQLLQAVAAIRFAESIKQRLHFHINATRVETAGDSVLMNLKALFVGTKHRLIQDEWMSHNAFLTRLDHMDYGMQVSLSETFSLVSADMVSVGLPIVVSPEVYWASRDFADPTDSDSVFNALRCAQSFPRLNVLLNRRALKKFSRRSKKTWLEFLDSQRSSDRRWGI